MNDETINSWISWIGGIRLHACTQPDLGSPNVIIHLVKEAHLPGGGSPSGWFLWQPEIGKPAGLSCFVTENDQAALYFGSKIFRGTAMEKVPMKTGRISVNSHYPESVSARAEIDDFSFEITLVNLGPRRMFSQKPTETSPLFQSGVAAVPECVELKVNGKPVPVFLPKPGTGETAPALWMPCGIYAR